MTEWCKGIEMSTTEHDSDAEPVINLFIYLLLK